MHTLCIDNNDEDEEESINLSNNDDVCVFATAIQFSANAKRDSKAAIL